MRPRSLFSALVCGSLISAGVALAQESGAPGPGAKPAVEDGEPIYGRDLMTPAEIDQQRKRMRAAKTEQEREQIRAEHHKQMQERAKERGVTLPDGPPARGHRGGPGRGMGPGPGPGMGPGPGAGPGPGGGTGGGS